MLAQLLLQVAYHASRALLQYVRAHLVSHMTSLQRRLRDAQVRLFPNNKHSSTFLGALLRCLAL
jgi:hypothetical protein